jgi:outer membrane protein assembly factor BamB
MQYLNNIQNNISRFFLLQDGLYYFTDKSLLIKFNEINHAPIWSIEMDTQYTLLGNSAKYLISFWQYRKIVNIIDGKIASEANIPFKPIKLKVDESIEGIFYYDKIFYYGYLSNDFKESKIIFSTQQRMPQTVTDNFIICFGESLNTIVCFKIGEGNPIWQKEFSEKITGDILVYDDKLLVSLWDSQDLICLEQSTGEEIWRCKEISVISNRIIKGNKLYQLSYHNYKVVDLDSGELIEYLDLSHLNERQLKITPIADCLENDRIYFTSSGYGSSFPLMVGSFNIKSLEYDWLHSFENIKKHGFPSDSLQYHDGRLYVLDMDNTLHIFEEET